MADEAPTSPPQRRLSWPATSRNTVGDATYRQPEQIADDLVRRSIPQRAQVVPLDAPDELLRLVAEFVERQVTSPPRSA